MMCINHIPECKKELSKLYLDLQQIQHYYNHQFIYNYNEYGNTYTNCCCGNVYCCILQLFENYKPNILIN